jgi:hypothetical protein
MRSEQPGQSLTGVLAQCKVLTHLDLRDWCCSGCDPIIAKRLTESWTGPKGDLKVDGLDSEESDDQSDW